MLIYRKEDDTELRVIWVDGRSTGVNLAIVFNLEVVLGLVRYVPELIVGVFGDGGSGFRLEPIRKMLRRSQDFVVIHGGVVVTMTDTHMAVDGHIVVLAIFTIKAVQNYSVRTVRHSQVSLRLREPTQD